MPSFTWLRSGHVLTCSQLEACTCAYRIYFLTGILAIVAGITSAVIGYGASMALLSDAPHSLSDGIADFIAAALVVYYGREVDEGKWHWLLAFLLLIATAWIAHEAYERITLADYPISGPNAFLGSTITLSIHFLRLRLLRTQGRITKLRNGVLGHVRADIRHAGVASLLGLVMSVLDFLRQRPLMKWFDISLTLILIVVLLRQTWHIAQGHGCEGHDHHDHGAGCDH